VASGASGILAAPQRATGALAGGIACVIPFTVKNVNNIALQFEEKYAWHEKRVERIDLKRPKSY
jgi:hypothetical protein